MQRQLEPEELMDETAQAEAYAKADFSEPNAAFLKEYAARFADGPQTNAGDTAHVLDLGCGPAEITLAFARQYPNCQVVGLDGSASMLRYGRDTLVGSTLAERVQLICGLIPGAMLPHPHYDVILSNSLLHHLADPMALWQSIRRYGRPGAQLLIMDLFRPSSQQAAQRIVAEYAAEEPEILRRDFYNSLLAAFQPNEVSAQLQEAKLNTLEVELISDRHLLVSGYLP